MKRKRLLCAVLALVMLLFAQSAASATYRNGNVRSTEIKADCRLPIVRVSVPSRATVLINPLALPVSIGGDEESGQIISTPACLVNRSDAALDVDVTVTGAVKEGSDMTLSQSPINGATGGAKRAFIYFEIQTADTEDTDWVEWDETFDASKHIVVTNRVPITKKNVIQLAPMTLDKEIGEGGYGPFRLTGDAVVNPTNEWTRKDGLSVEIAFTFTPVPVES